MLSLSTILKVNAISSGATGAGLIFLGSPIAALFHVESATPFIYVGVFLVSFALFVFSVSTKNPVNKKAVGSIVFLDTLWVISSVIASIFLYSVISILGTLIILAVALWVAAMAYLQSRGLKVLYNSNTNIRSSTT